MRSEKDYWNEMAAHYNNLVSQNPDESDYPERLMRYLKEKGAVSPGSRAADIGCGAGKYAVRFAKENMSLLLTDLAGNMLDFCRANLKDFMTEVNYRECDFAKTDPVQEGWEKRFDLVFASMTPAVSTPESVRKLVCMSKRHCFFSKFAEVHNEMAATACEAVGLPDPISRAMCTDLEPLLKPLKEAGITPEITYQPYAWQNRHSPREAFSTVIRQLTEKNGDFPGLSPEEERRITLALKKLQDPEGRIVENVETVAVWVYWRTDGI